MIPIAFLTSAFAGVFGMGGGVPLITLMPGLVPAAAIIPLHALTQLASNGSRAWMSRSHIDYSLVAPFLLGGVLGALFGGALFNKLDLRWLPGLIGLVILVITWLPLPLVRGAGRLPLVFLGFYQTGIGMLIGASGPLGAALLTQRNSKRDWLVANTAVYMSVNHALRAVAFVFMGFTLWPWLPLLGGMIVGATAGSWVGTRLRQFIPEGNFQFYFKLLISALALRLIIGVVVEHL